VAAALSLSPAAKSVDEAGQNYFSGSGGPDGWMASSGTDRVLLQNGE
jgi:hypothetical protein